MTSPLLDRLSRRGMQMKTNRGGARSPAMPLATFKVCLTGHWRVTAPRLQMGSFAFSEDFTHLASFSRHCPSLSVCARVLHCRPLTDAARSSHSVFRARVRTCAVIGRPFSLLSCPCIQYRSHYKLPSLCLSVTFN